MAKIGSTVARISADSTDCQYRPRTLPPASPGSLLRREAERPSVRGFSCPHATASSDTVRASRGHRQPRTTTGRRPPGVLQPAAVRLSGDRAPGGWTAALDRGDAGLPGTATATLDVPASSELQADHRALACLKEGRTASNGCRGVVSQAPEKTIMTDRLHRLMDAVCRVLSLGGVRLW